MSSRILSKEQRESYNLSADYARSAFLFPRWNIVALSMRVSGEAFDDEMDRLSHRNTRYMGQIATGSGPIGLVQYAKPVIDTVREIVIVGGDFTDSQQGLGVVHSLWLNNSGVASFEKKYDLTFTYDTLYSLRRRPHLELTVPGAHNGRVEIELQSPYWLLRRSPWDTSSESVGLDIPINHNREERNQFMKLADSVHWLDIAGDYDIPPELIGVDDFTQTARTKAEEVSAVKLFKSIAKHLAANTDDIRAAWLHDALYNSKFLYRGSLGRVFVSTQAVYDIATQVTRAGLKIPGLGFSGAYRLQAIFDNIHKEPTDTELLGHKPEDLAE